MIRRPTRGFAFLFDAARQSVGWVAAGTAIAMVVAVSNVVLLALSGWFITAMALAGMSHLALDIFASAALIRALAILRTGGRYAERYVTHDATLRLLGTLRQQLFARIVPLAPAGLVGWRSSDLLARLRADIDDLDNAYLRLWVPIASFVICMPLLGLYEARYSIWLAAINLSGIILVDLCLPILSLVSRRGIDRQKASLRADLYGRVTEMTAGYDELLVDGALAHHQEYSEELALRLDGLKRRENSIVAALDGAAGVVAQITLVGMLVLTLALYTAGALTGPKLVLLFTLSLASFELAGTLPAALQAWGKTHEAADRVAEIVGLVPPMIAEGKQTTRPETLELRLRGICLAYGPDLPDVLSHVDLDIAAGQILLIRGASGSGKSSLINAILRFWPMAAGTMHMGAVRAETFTLDTWRSFFSVAEQDSLLFHDTIRANLTIAAPDATDAELWSALGQAAIADEVRAMPQQLDTVIGEYATGLSGGQARRITLARAFLKPAPILLLDEPTENLDAQAETIVLNTLALLAAKGRSVVIISHRLTRPAAAHTILEMKDGRLAAA